ncbi:AraC family transcriptional regulator [Hoeflea marina]|uniref:AraC family transcriptional regulator n=1 Tax=Hoeflea marina TaxID=274592 RepID=A0A317PDD5_9HYPH|nr:helix-turn-helix domain-containing protein [Hoeflea marina]PWV95162.1 AraC family transcriptional regulator [Hoeflea marina]
MELPDTRLPNRDGSDSRDRLRKDRFTTSTQPAGDQFAYWKSFVSPLVDVTQATSRQGFLARGTAYDLGKLHYVSAVVDPLSYQRTQAQIRDSDMDHWALVLLQEGRLRWHSGGKVMDQPVGSAVLRSFAFPFEANADTTRSVTLFLSRDNFMGMAEMLDGSIDRPVPGTMNNIISEFVLSLSRYIGRLTMAEIPIVANSLSVLLKAAMAPTVENLEAGALPISSSLFDMARRNVIKNLSNPELGPASLCRALGVSRRQLYYVFERRGGIAKYIRQRRLAACHEAFEDLTDHRLISTIAYGNGFTNPGQFSRHFHAAYGYSPSEAREARLFGYTPHKTAPASFSEWLLQVRAGE